MGDGFHPPPISWHLEALAPCKRDARAEMQDGMYRHALQSAKGTLLLLRSGLGLFDGILLETESVCLFPCALASLLPRLFLCQRACLVVVACVLLVLWRESRVMAKLAIVHTYFCSDLFLFKKL